MQNKLDELHFHFQCVTVDADFIFVTEVLPKYYPDNISYASMIYHIDGYKAFHSSDNGRRVIIYAKATYNISPNQYLNSKYHDATWCDWTVDHKTIILGGIYRSPSDIQSCESINHLFNEVSEISDNVLITGDFNYKDINWVISESEVLKHLKELDASKAMGPDNINPFLIKSIAEVFVKPLTLIFQKSVSSGIVPSAWKEAKITPRYKKGNKTEPSNYRPVTLTLEKLVRKSILSHLTENHLLSDKQYGFRSSRSCSLQLLNVMERWTEYDEQHQSWDTIYLDLAKAFDKVEHQRLLKKISSYGIKGALLSWISSFLLDRRQCVSIKGSSSTWKPVESGVPQGSVLGPIFFIMYVNDIPDIVKSNMWILADDTKLFASTDQTNTLQEDLDNLIKWAELWELTFNVIKCKLIHYGQNKPENDYIMHDKKLESVDEECDLGVNFTRDLKFSQHIAKKVN